MTGMIQQIIFQRQHRLLRHLLFWTIYFLVFSTASSLDLGSVSRGIETTAVFIPLNALYAYLILYCFVPALLVKEKYLLFF